jgi:hypothetical protein
MLAHDPRMSDDPEHKIETDNPALIAAEFQRGLYPSGIDWDKVKRLANMCDEMVPVEDET